MRLNRFIEKAMFFDSPIFEHLVRVCALRACVKLSTTTTPQIHSFTTVSFARDAKQSQRHFCLAFLRVCLCVRACKSKWFFAYTTATLQVQFAYANDAGSRERHRLDKQHTSVVDRQF